MSIYTDLARETIKGYLTKEALPNIKQLSPELSSKHAGCFVSIHLKSNDELRGCIGTILPVHKNLAGEIIANSIEAALHDPRFAPVTKDELNNLKYSVDVLSEIEAIKSEKELDVNKYGVIVKSFDGLRTGLLLPNLDGVDKVEQQIDIAKDKAGMEKDEPAHLFRFSSTRYEQQRD